MPGWRPGTGQLLGLVQLTVTQLPLPAGVGHSVTVYDVQGPPLVGGVMTRAADVGLVGVALAMTGWESEGVATVAGAEVGEAVPPAVMPTACSKYGRKREVLTTWTELLTSACSQVLQLPTPV